MEAEFGFPKAEGLVALDVRGEGAHFSERPKQEGAKIRMRRIESEGPWSHRHPVVSQTVEDEDKDGTKTSVRHLSIEGATHAPWTRDGTKIPKDGEPEDVKPKTPRKCVLAFEVPGGYVGEVEIVAVYEDGEEEVVSTVKIGEPS